MGRNPKVRRLGRIAKIPKATHSQDLHPGEMEPKYLEEKWGPPTLSSLEPKERGQENRTRAGVTSAAAPQVHRREQHLLLGSYPLA